MNNSYRLITEENVNIGHNSHHGLKEKLRQEWSWEIHAERLQKQGDMQ